jgi:hypothetical protein
VLGVAAGVFDKAAGAGRRAASGGDALVAKAYDDAKGAGDAKTYLRRGARGGRDRRNQGALQMKTDQAVTIAQTFNGRAEWVIAGGYFKLMVAAAAVTLELWNQGRKVLDAPLTPPASISASISTRSSLRIRRARR